MSNQILALPASAVIAVPTAKVLGRTTGGTGAAEALNLSDVLDMIGSAAQGDILYRGASGWARLGAGTVGHALTTGGAGANPSWAAASAPAISVRTSTFTAAASGRIAYLCDSTSGSFTVNLPAAASATSEIVVKLTATSGTNTVTLDANSAELIDGSATQILYVAGDTLCLVSDGTGWRALAKNLAPHICRLYRGTAQALASGAITQVQFDNAEANIGGMANLGSYAVVVRRAGQYTVTASHSTASAMDDGEFATAYITVNGSVCAHDWSYSPAADRTVTCVASKTLALAAGDTVTLGIYHNEGGSINTQTRVYDRPTLDVVELGSGAGGGAGGAVFYYEATGSVVNNASITITHAADAEFVRIPQLLVGADGAGTTLLLNFNGANGSTTITDSGPNGLSATATSPAALSTTRSKFGSASLLLTNAGNVVVSSALVALGNGDFTIDFWAYPTALTQDSVVLDYRNQSSSPDAGPLIVMYSNGALRYSLHSGSVIDSGAGVITTGAWYHIAVCRSGAATRMFLNGAQVGSTWTDSRNWTSTVLSIGNSYGNDFSMPGHIDAFRLAVGVARYTANFTPDTAEPALVTAYSPVLLSSHAVAGDSDRFYVRFDDGTGANQATKTTFTNKTGATRLYKARVFIPSVTPGS